MAHPGWENRLKKEKEEKEARKLRIFNGEATDEDKTYIEKMKKSDDMFFGTMASKTKQGTRAKRLKKPDGVSAPKPTYAEKAQSDYERGKKVLQDAFRQNYKASDRKR